MKTGNMIKAALVTCLLAATAVTNLSAQEASGNAKSAWDSYISAFYERQANKSYDEAASLSARDIKLSDAEVFKQLDSVISADLSVIAWDLKSFSDSHSDKKICWSNYGDDIISTVCREGDNFDKIMPFLSSSSGGFAGIFTIVFDIAANACRVVAYSAHDVYATVCNKVTSTKAKCNKSLNACQNMTLGDLKTSDFTKEELSFVYAMLKTVRAGLDFILAEKQYYLTPDAYGNAEDDEKVVRQEAKQLKKLLENKKMDYTMFQKIQKARMEKNNKKNSDDNKEMLKEDIRKTKEFEKQLKKSAKQEKEDSARAEKGKQKHKKALVGK
jgi:hypothetical protein